MVVRASHYFNNPDLAQAAANLASLFEPPSGADAAGWATANAKNAEAKRLSEAYLKIIDPSLSHEMVDRYAIGTGLAVPTQSYYAVDQGNATTRRGQDRSFEASRLNNADDNARALQTNSADNMQALEDRRLQEAGALQRLYATPITAPTGSTVYLPKATADASGLPRTLSGNISLQPGETIQTPDGHTFGGQPKPLSSDEWQAAQNERLRQTGALDDQQILDIILGKSTPVMVVGPGNKPQYASPGAAVRARAQPFFEPKAGSVPELSQLIAARDALPPGDPNRAAYDARIAALGRGQQQSKYDQASDENLAKFGEEIFANANKALVQKNVLDQALTAINDPSVDQGALGPATLTVRKYLNAFGINGGDTSPAEMLSALGNSIAIQLRDPSNGAGMPGSLSDSDRQFLASMSVSLGNSREANRKLAELYLGTQQKNVTLEVMREDYIRQHGRIDEGFRTQAAEYQRRFYDEAAGRASSALPQSDVMPGPGASTPVQRSPLSSTPTFAPGNAGYSGGVVPRRDAFGGYFGYSPQPPSLPAPPSPPAPPGSGTPIMVQTPEEAMRLPSGTQFVTPDGRVKVRP